MSKHEKCERCPHEHTERCNTCKQDTKAEPVQVGTKEAINYFTEENETFEHMMGDKAKLLIEYRVNRLAIEALKKNSINETFMAAGLIKG